MKAQVVTEGESDRILLTNLLRNTAREDDFEVRPAGGRSAAISLAKSLLRRDAPAVALVVDADTVDDQRIREEYALLQDSMAEAVAANRRPYTVVLVVPEIERLLFEDRATAESLVGGQITDADWVRAKFEPKKVLAARLPRVSRDGGRLDLRALDELLRTVDLRALTKSNPIQRITQLIESSVAARN